MTKLLANRWFRTACIAIALVALGVGIYRLTPPEPMCVIEGKLTPIRFTEEGRALVTMPMQVEVMGLQNPWAILPGARGPFEVWDTHHGVRKASSLPKEAIEQASAFSKDGRYFACQQKRMMGDETQVFLSLIDLLAGSSREIPLPETDHPITSLHFSPRGDLLLRHCVFDEKPLRIFDTASGELLAHRNSNGFDVPEGFLENAFLHDVPKESKHTMIEVWSWRERKPIALLENAGPNRAVSPDGRYYVAERLSPEGLQVGKWSIWNLQTYRLEAEYQSEDMLVNPRVISPDGRWLAAVCMGDQGGYVELRELPTGKQVATMRVVQVKAITFAPDGGSLALQHPGGPTETVEIVDVPSLKSRWKLEGLEPATKVQFSPDGQTVYLGPDATTAIGAHDLHTGRLRTTFHLTPRHPMQIAPTIWFTPDGRTLLVQEQVDFVGGPVPFRMRVLQWVPWLPMPGSVLNDTVAVIDTNSCAERFRLHGWGVTSALLSDDGRTLVTVHDETEERRVLRCWDVGGGKPMHWAIGVPLVLAALCVVPAWWRQRRHRTTVADAFGS
jgi:WD40 repeat protein